MSGFKEQADYVNMNISTIPINAADVTHKPANQDWVQPSDQFVSDQVPLMKFHAEALPPLVRKGLFDLVAPLQFACWNNSGLFYLTFNHLKNHSCNFTSVDSDRVSLDFYDWFVFSVTCEHAPDVRRKKNLYCFFSFRLNKKEMPKEKIIQLIL